MIPIAQRITNRLLLSEGHPDVDPHSPDYDRQTAEDRLYHTIGPMTKTPRWTGTWTSPGEPPADFRPNGPAPQWTPEEVVFAYAGDPNLLFKGSGNPRSPEYGTRGGAPLLRLAKRVARFYRRDKDRSFIADLYGNGMIAVAQSTHPGFDEARSAYIPWMTRNVQSAMEHGIGGENRTDRAAGEDSEKTGLRGLKSIMKEKDPAAIRAAANVVKGQYREKRSHDKNPDNPFGPFSSAYYQAAMAHADAVESGDEDAIERSMSRMQQIVDDIDDYSTPIRGASTGLGQAISTPDRKTSIGVASIDAPASSDNEAGMAGNIVGDTDDENTFSPEMVYYVLGIALSYDIGKILSGSTRYKQMAAELGADNIGGVMTVNELRYVIRTLGPIGSNYPGRGQMRANTDIPRDSRGWWQPNEDPEIEPLPSGEGTWKSIWTRSNYQSLGPTAITEEMTDEVREFEKLGIQTARVIKSKAKGKVEVVSKVAVANTIKAATVKLKIIAHIHRDHLGLDNVGDAYTAEDRNRLVSAGVISESLDQFDARLISETCHRMITKANRALTFDYGYRPIKRNVIESRLTRAAILR